MTYYDVDRWSRVYDLVVNRVSIINQTLGARYDGLDTNPVRIRYRRGVYSCYVCGAPYCSFHVYDLDSTQCAFDSLSCLADGLWYLMRSGRMSFT